MICPICKKTGARRSHRQTVADHLMSIFGVYPWRCQECHSRFHSRMMPLGNLLRAHCPFCGNAELRRISPDFVGTTSAPLWRLLGIPAFRCDPCRHKYFSVLPMKEAEDGFYTSSPAD